MCLYIDVEEHELGDLGEPANCKAALLDPEYDKWLNAINVEMQSMKDNKIDYEETFSPVADIRAIRIRIAITAFYDYEIWKWMSKLPSSIDISMKRISCYTDAGYLTDVDDMKSQTGYVCVLNGGAVDWKRTKQSIFATSSIDVEYIAAFDASKEAVWIRKFVYGLGVVPTIEEPINMHWDNTRAIAIAKDHGVTKGARHFRAKVHYLRETIEMGDVRIEKVDTDDNLADPFIKALSFPKHSELTEKIGMIPANDNDDDNDTDNGSYKGEPNGDDLENVVDFKGDSDSEVVPDTKFDEEPLNKNVEEASVGQKEMRTENPFNIYGLLNKKKENINKESNLDDSLKYPQETKMENIDLFSIKRCWENFAFDYVHSTFVGNSGRILCVWDPKTFIILNATVSDYFVMVRGDWVPNGTKLLIILVYAPQELTDKKLLWDYLSHVMAQWEGDVVVMGDFNEVRKKDERFGSIFNVHGANAFNLFISNAGLEDVPIGGCFFTWRHKSASKMSKLDRFLIFESLMNSCPNISSITLDRYLSDHRPILMHEPYYNYGPVLFRFFHYWFEIKGFDKLVKDSWNEAVVIKAMEMKMLSIKELMLSDLFKNWRNLNHWKRPESVKCAIEGDENSKYYHGILNKKRSQLAIRGILVDGIWIDSPCLVKSEFLSHFKKRFDYPQESHLQLDLNFPNMPNYDQLADLEREVSKDEIKRAVWDCGTDKSPGPDGFTFGSNSSFIALIPKNPDANMVKDFRPISLIGSMYKIIAKILANRLVFVLGDLVNEVQSAFVADRQILDGPFILNEIVQWCKSKKKQSLVFKVDFEKAFDSVRWDYLDDILRRCLAWGNCVQNLFPRAYALESCKNIDIASKLSHSNLAYSFRRGPRGGVEQDQYNLLMAKVEGTILVNMRDRWVWSLEGSGDFSVASVRKLIDEHMLSEVASRTRWIKEVPIKVNVLAWKIKLDYYQLD
ncbi:RNA-directed DNA polymerase, eukaryota [Tanacetum coccineum]